MRGAILYESFFAAAAIIIVSESTNIGYRLMFFLAAIDYLLYTTSLAHQRRSRIRPPPPHSVPSLAQSLTHACGWKTATLS